MNSNGVFGCSIIVIFILIGLFATLINVFLGLLIIGVGVIIAVSVVGRPTPATIAESAGEEDEDSSDCDDDNEDADDDDDDESAYKEPGCRQLHTIVVGTRYNNPSGKSRSRILSWMAIGERLFLKPYLFEGEPAVAVLNSNGEDIGNLRKELAEEFTHKCEIGQIGSIFLTKREKVDGYYRANIIINIQRQ